MAIKNIIFDLGGVLLDIDFGATAAAFQRHGVQDFATLFSLARQEAFFDVFEVGGMTPEAFRQALRTALDANLSDQELDAAWNAMLLTLPRDRLLFVQGLKKRYHVMLFSNTNAIHMEHFLAAARQSGVGDLFEACFHKTYYSHLLGARKPAPAAFLRLLAENDLVAAETLFVDDSTANIEGARQAGLHVFHITQERSVFAVQDFLASQPR